MSSSEKTLDCEIDDIGNYRQELSPEQFRALYLTNISVQQMPTALINRRYRIVKNEATYRVSREKGKLRIIRCAADDVDKLGLLRMIQNLTQEVAQIQADIEELQDDLLKLKGDNDNL